MMPDCSDSTVFLPMTDRGRTSCTFMSWAAREASASTEISMPGARTPPRNSPVADTTSKLVDVPKSTTIAGPPCNVNPASVFTIRSAPTSFGLSYSTGTPVRMPGSTTTSGTAPNQRSHIDRTSRNADGTVEQHAIPSTVPSVVSEAPSNPVTSSPNSSAERRGSVASRQCSTMCSPSKRPSTVWVLPTSIVSSIGTPCSQVDADVEHRRGVCQSAYCEVVDTCSGHGGGARQRQPTACFQAARAAAFGHLGDRRPHGLQRHVVEQDEIGARLQRLSNLLDGVALDFDEKLRKRCAHGAECGRNPTCRDHVVVLDQGRIGQRHPMVHPAPAPDRVLLQRARGSTPS